MASRRHFLRAAAVAAAPLPVIATPAEGKRWTGDWPAHLKDAVERAMPVAVEWARPARWPFGAVLVDVTSGAVAAQARNTTERDGDRTAHAELNLLREAAGSGLHLPSYAVVSTAEPCAMCAGALLWTGVRAVAYGTSVAALASYGVPQIGLSFAEIAGHARMPRPALGRGIRTDLTDPLYRGLTR